MKQEANNMKKKRRQKEKKRQRKLEIPDFLTHLIVSPRCLSEQQNKAVCCGWNAENASYCCHYAECDWMRIVLRLWWFSSFFSLNAVDCCSASPSQISSFGIRLDVKAAYGSGQRIFGFWGDFRSPEGLSCWSSASLSGFLQAWFSVCEDASDPSV